MQATLTHLFWCGVVGVLLFAHGPTDKQEIDAVRQDVGRCEKTIDGLQEELIEVWEEFEYLEEAFNAHTTRPASAHRQSRRLRHGERDVIGEIFGP